MPHREASIASYISVVHQELLIAGYRIGGPCDQAVGKEVVRNPYDGSIVGTVAEGGWSELSTALASAHDAFDSWRKSSIGTRIELLLNIASLTKARRQELADLAVKEIGKPVNMALAEVDRLVRTFELAAKELESDEWISRHVDISYDPRSQGAKAFVERRPRGVVYAITPYNWPYNLAAHKLAPALATGNTVILKPNPLSALCTLTLAHLIHEAGCPPGVVNCWNGPTPLVEKALRDPRVKMISFTGSAAVGWSIKQAHSQLPVTLELGGNAPAIICSSADLDQAIGKLVPSAYGYAGQVCISLQNLYVHESVYDEVRIRLIEAVKAVSTGDPSREETLCGPLIGTNLVEKILNMIDASGGKVLVGGEPNGNLLPPQLIEEPRPGSPLMTEEVFGPVLTLSRFSDLGDLAKDLNCGKYGIHASIFTNSDDDILVASEIETGGLIVNDSPSLRFDSLPYGGVRESGFGREGVCYAMEEMTELRSTVIRP
ncbi:MAG: aldehyde dehydrogenase family protein [Armatimonadetes bacterium]|nr:aldehyde dehydrogenase family protein [Armatimonadota bacterium]